MIILKKQSRGTKKWLFLAWCCTCGISAYSLQTGHGVFWRIDCWSFTWKYFIFHALSKLTSDNLFNPDKGTQKQKQCPFLKWVHNVAASTRLPCCFLSTYYLRQHSVHCVTSDQDNSLGFATCNPNIHPWLCEAARFHSVSQSPGCRNNQTETLIRSHCAALYCPSSFCQGGKWLRNREENLFLRVTSEKHRWKGSVHFSFLPHYVAGHQKALDSQVLSELLCKSKF